MKFRKWANSQGTMTCLVCSLLAGMGTSAAADDIDDVEFPAGAASFADRVVTVTMEGNPEPAPDGGEALGAPDELAFGLGNGGRLVVEFVDNVLVPSGDENPDLGIISVAEPAAATTVSVSSDGILWETLGTVDAGKIGIDLDALGFDRDDRFRFVEMVDIAGESGAAEIDAVGAISTMSPSGGVDAIFENPLGGDAMVVTGVGTPVFGWGEALFPNSLQFRAGSYTGGVEREFDLGSLTYFNGTTTSGTTAERVSLAVTLDTGGADEATTFVFQLELQSTPNTGNAFQNADIVRLPNPFSAEEIVVQGNTYRLQLSFEAATAGGVTELDRFFAIEGQTVSAVLRGRLTTESALDGCAPRRLTFDHGNETVPTWNPAGGTIAFATNRNFGRDIGGIEDDRAGERLLAKGMGTGLVGEVLAWQDQWVTTTETRSTHEVLAFDTKREPGDRESFDESEDRGEFSTLLTFSSTGGFFVLSRDGSTALWNDWDGVRSTLRSAGYAVLVGQSASAVGTVLREQLGIGRKAVMHSAALSADGDFVILSEEIEGGGHDLLRFSIDAGDEAEVLTSDEAVAGATNRYPAVSPDGQRVAFSSAESAGEPGDIYVLELTTGDVRNVTMTEGIDETQPDWSPDGGSLVYSRFDSAGSSELRTNELPNWSLYVQCLEELNDRDDDGIADLLEAAFGSDPNHPDQIRLPEIVMETVDGQSRVGVTFTVRINGEQTGTAVWQAGGFEYALESSTDLKQWQRGSVTIDRASQDTVGGSGREQLKILLDDSVDTLGEVYLRVAVKRVPLQSL